MEAGDLSLERVALAAVMALLATVALPIGAALGILTRPPQRLVAIVMAFGSGALVEALAVDLAFEGAAKLAHEYHFAPINAWAVIGAGFMVGGLTFFGANRAIEQRGGALRKQATTRAYIEEQKREAAAVLLGRLAKVNILRSLPPEEMDGLLRYVKQVEVPAGQLLFRAGDAGDALYLVDRGRVDILRSGVEPDRQSPAAAGYTPLATLGPGESFGEIALLSGEPRTASAVAAEDSVLLRIGKEDFDHLIVHSPGLRDAVQQLNLERVLRSARTASADDTERWRETAVRSIRRVSNAEHEALAREAVEAHGGGAPMAMFLGTVLDGIPESIVIGARFTSLAAFNPGFVIAVFLNNLPEAMSSAVGMQRNGFSRRRIMGMWFGLMIVSGIFAALGNVFLATAPPAITAFVNGIAGGGILAMLAATMMPEAFEEGGPSVGLATIAGFLSAFLFAVLALG